MFSFPRIKLCDGKWKKIRLVIAVFSITTIDEGFQNLIIKKKDCHKVNANEKQVANQETGTQRHAKVRTSQTQTILNEMTYPVGRLRLTGPKALSNSNQWLIRRHFLNSEI